MKLFTIPNLLTLGNLLCGCFGIFFVFEGDLKMASYLTGLALLLDFGDGFLARLLNSASPIGKELDSLADMVTFGALPAFVVFSLARNATGEFPEYLPYLAFVIAVFSALRLAKFNIDTRQSESFIGLPTPANGMIVAAFPFILDNSNLAFLANPWVLIAYAFVISFLLIAEIPLFALKFKNFTWQDNRIKYIFLVLSLVLLVLFMIPAIPLIIILYFLLSLLIHLKVIS
jgi:CDP-diacylglycerol--serine O-phosphatidyltransferase